MAGLYIHIPFCRQACSYCDFYFVTRTRMSEEYVDKLVQEIESYGETAYRNTTFKTLYIGGGTPSVLPPAQLGRVVQSIEDTFLTDWQEVTLEMNPDDVSADFLREIKKLGITRPSMGVQSFNADLLDFMNRAHDRRQALDCMKLLNDSNFTTYNVDLIYGNPEQSLDQLDRDLDRFLSFDPPHISAYALTIEPNTRLGKQVELGRLQPAEEELVARHFDRVVQRLSERNIEQYEVSNYCKSGYEAVHNSNYWNHRSYLGLGPGAHSFWWQNGKSRAIRWNNKPDIRGYLKAGDPKDHLGFEEQLSLEQLSEERIMMGLRTRRGVAQSELEQTYHYELNEEQEQLLHQLKNRGLLISMDPMRLTTQGLKVADSIIRDLVSLK